jgi:hypothetical protein
MWQVNMVIYGKLKNFIAGNPLYTSGLLLTLVTSDLGII